MALFKYLHPDRIDVLKNQCIRFSSPKALNDPFELKPHISALASSTEIDIQVDDSFPELVKQELAQLPSAVRSLITKAQIEEMMMRLLLDIKQGTQQLAREMMPTVRTAFTSGIEFNRSPVFD